MKKIISILFLMVMILSGISYGKQTLSNEEIYQLLDDVARVTFMGMIPPKDLLQKATEAKTQLMTLGKGLLPYLLERLHAGRTDDITMFCAILPSGIPEIIDMAHTTQDSTLRQKVVWFIGRLVPEKEGYKGVDKTLISALERIALNDNEWTIREEALLSLSNLRAPISKPMAIIALADSNDRVRVAAVCALEYLIDKQAKENLLAEKANDKSALVRYAVGMTSERKSLAIPLLKESVANQLLEQWARERADWKLKNYKNWIEE